MVLDELADRADAAVAKVVDVIDLITGLAFGEVDDVAHGGDDILDRERGGVALDAEFLVDFVAADLGEVIALGIEEQTLEQAARGIDRGRLARTQATVQLDEGFLTRGRRILLERALDHLAIAEQVDDLVAGLGNAERAKKKRRRLLALAVDADGKHVALVGLELEPCAARGDDLRIIYGAIARLIALGGEVHARRANELGDDDALGAVDDEGAAVRHEREIAHEDVGLLHLAGLLVDEANVDEERSLVRDVALLALLDGMLGVAKLVGAELDAKGLRAVLDGRHAREGFVEALGHQIVERVDLNGNQVGDVHDLGELREAETIAIHVGLGRYGSRHYILLIVVR